MRGQWCLFSFHQVASPVFPRLGRDDEPSPNTTLLRAPVENEGRSKIKEERQLQERRHYTSDLIMSTRYVKQNIYEKDSDKSEIFPSPKVNKPSPCVGLLKTQRNDQRVDVKTLEYSRFNQTKYTINDHRRLSIFLHY